jgi:ribosomal protein S18 acetylase RimI-like enzyme
MLIRLATGDDASGIAEVQVRGWHAAYRGIIPDSYLETFTVEARTERWRSILAETHHPLWVAEDAGEVRGWISAGPSRDDDARPETGELWALYIHPDHWRSGIGRALWDIALNYLRQAGFSRVTLWVLEENRRGRAFYESVGFGPEPDRVKDYVVGGVAVPEVRLVTSISAGES